MEETEDSLLLTSAKKGQLIAYQCKERTAYCLPVQGKDSLLLASAKEGQLNAYQCKERTAYCLPVQRKDSLLLTSAKKGQLIAYQCKERQTGERDGHSTVNTYTICQGRERIVTHPK